eukprot:809302-Amphidinium_carterae.1
MPLALTHGSAMSRPQARETHTHNLCAAHMESFAPATKGVRSLGGQGNTRTLLLLLPATPAPCA